jgi:hypothetical protein
MCEAYLSRANWDTTSDERGITERVMWRSKWAAATKKVLDRKSCN